MLLSMLLALYGSHRRVWLRLDRASGGTRISLGGHSSKHQASFEREFTKLTQEIGDLSANRNTHV